MILSGGTVYSEIGGVTEALFKIDGSLEIPFDDPTATVSDPGNSGERFQLAGLDVNVEELTIQSDGFRLGGDFVLPKEMAGIELPIPLDNPDTIIFKQDGISLGASGKVDFQKEMEFKLLNLLEVEVEDLSISYEAPTDTAKIQGKLELESLVKSFDPELIVDLTDPNFIQIKDGEVDDGKVTLAVEDIKPAKGWEIGASITLDTSKDELTGRGSIVFPFSSKSTKGKKKKGGLDLELGFKNLTELDSIETNVALPVSIPVGTTGFFLNEIGGGLKNLAPSNKELVEYSGGVKLTGGPKFKSIGLINLDLKATINAEQFKGNGKVTVINESIAEGNVVEAILNWNKKFLKAEGNYSILNGAIDGGGMLYADSKNLQIYGKGNARAYYVYFLYSTSSE